MKMSANIDLVMFLPTAQIHWGALVARVSLAIKAMGFIVKVSVHSFIRVCIYNCTMCSVDYDENCHGI